MATKRKSKLKAFFNAVKKIPLEQFQVGTSEDGDYLILAKGGDTIIFNEDSAEINPQEVPSGTLSLNNSSYITWFKETLATLQKSKKKEILEQAFLIVDDEYREKVESKVRSQEEKKAAKKKKLEPSAAASVLLASRAQTGTTEQQPVEEPAEVAETEDVLQFTPPDGQETPETEAQDDSDEDWSLEDLDDDE